MTPATQPEDESRLRRVRVGSPRLRVSALATRLFLQQATSHEHAHMVATPPAQLGLWVQLGVFRTEPTPCFRMARSSPALARAARLTSAPRTDRLEPQVQRVRQTQIDVPARR